MTFKSTLAVLAILVLGQVSALATQSDEVKLNTVQAKITTVSAMRARRAPQVTAEEVVRLKLGTVVNAVARSANQDTIGGKTDYWYRVNLPNSIETGWLFGGLLLDYNPPERTQLLRQIIEARLKAENTGFADRQEIYNLAASSIAQAKDVNTRAEFELLKLLALANWATTVPADENAKSPYREWLKAHAAEVVHNEFAGGYNLRTEVLWNLEAKYHALPIAERIAWAAVENPEPSDCEGDELCHFFVFSGGIKYLSLHPNGAHASQALKDLNELLTDEVIETANGKGGGEQYMVEARTNLRKLLKSLRLALAKVSGSSRDKAELLKKLQRVKTA
jgi:hypothetical protein